MKHICRQGDHAIAIPWLRMLVCWQVYLYILVTSVPDRVFGWNHHQQHHHRPESTGSRRQALEKLSQWTVFGGCSVLVVPSSPALAGELGAKITRAVTESELGISVRRSVVQGAQTFDRLDSQWEAFSDRFGLGVNRNKQPARPAPKFIPELRPLDTQTAMQILQIVDATFCEVSQTNPKDLERKIERVQEMVQPAFERSGLVMAADPKSNIQTAPQFNFMSYVHYKAFLEILVERNIDFKGFLQKFETQAGRQLVRLFLPTDVTPPSGILEATADASQKREVLAFALQSIQALGQAWVGKGLLAQIDIGIDNDNIDDWSLDGSDLDFSIAVDNDSVLSSQILLQEQGWRFYPNYARYAFLSILRMLFEKTMNISAEDYYLDTDYNSNPDLFQVKEVLINIHMEYF
jgi:hypothetical protein